VPSQTLGEQYQTLPPSFGYPASPPGPQPFVPAPPLRPKDEALRRLGLLKRGILAGTVVAFGALIGLVATHRTGVTSDQASQTVPSDQTPSQFAPPASGDDNGGFFSQQPGGFGFGNGSSSSPPVSGSRTS
jgi:hypothetical protein